MKKVIFVCLLSLSVCLSQPNQEKETPQSSPPVHAANATGVEAKADPSKPEHPVTPPHEEAAKTPKDVPAQPTQNSTSANVTPNEKASNETTTVTNETKPAEKNSTVPKPVTDTPAKSDGKKVDQPKGNETMPIVPAIHNGTNADSKDSKKNETTTPKGGNVSPTVAPVEAKSRAFDGPSFIGGMILTLGLLAIGFMGFKYYKNQTERNYHTL